MTFKQYIASTLIAASPEGDFIADARSDRNFPEFESYQDLARYLAYTKKADVQVIEAAKNVWENYQAFMGVLPQGQPKSGVVEIDRTLVRVLGEPLAEIFWRSKQWAVTAYGIECLDGRYLIDKERLLQDLERHPWTAHMDDKPWVDTDEFATAWMVGVLLHGHGKSVTADEVKRALSFVREHQ